MARNVFFSNNDLTFSGQLKSFIRENKYGYYLDIWIPDNIVAKLVMYKVIPVYDGGFYLRCRARSTSEILCNGRKLSYLSDELNSQELVTSNNTKLKSLYLSIYSLSHSSDSTVYINRAIFQTTSQKLPINFQN